MLNPAHASHDQLLVARYAARDAYPSEIDQAQRLVDGCAQCAALAADIQLISARTSELPAVRRPRDFRISPEQAESLRGSWFDRLMRAMAAPGWTVVRPLAGAALAIALVFVVVGALPLDNLRGGAAPEAAAPALSGGASSAAAPSPQEAEYAAVSPPNTQNNADLGASPPIAMPSTVPASTKGASQAPDAGMAVKSELPTGVATGPNSVPASSEVAPPKSYESPPLPLKPATPLTPATPNIAVIVPTAQPSPEPPARAVTGNAMVPVTSQSVVDRTALVAAGLLLGFIALMALALVWAVRRRYSDPLVR